MFFRQIILVVYLTLKFQGNQTTILGEMTKKLRKKSLF